MDKALQIELHLQSTVPVLKGKHRPPIEPKVRAENLVIKDILNRFIVEVLIPCEEELQDLHGALLTQTESPVGVRILSAALGRPAEGIVRVVLIEPIVFVEHGDSLRL